MLPPYSPDLNPIEQFFAKLKALLRKAAAKTLDALIAAIAHALTRVRPRECENYLANLGYRETRSIPIVFAGLTDPVEEGFVQNMARPGGNITGFTNFETSLIGKLLELLKEISPRTTRVALVQTPDDPAEAARMRYFETAAAAMNVRPISAPLRAPTDIEGVIASLGRDANGGLVVMPSATVIVHRHEIIAAAARHRVPAIYPFRLFVNGGGLLFYGSDILDLTRRSAGYIDRIFKGEKPSDLPVQAPTKFELVINLKTAKALGLDVPWFLQQRADEVIE
jgi:putative ABC transport system substrate-binding protein